MQGVSATPITTGERQHRRRLRRARTDHGRCRSEHGARGLGGRHRHDRQQQRDHRLHAQAIAATDSNEIAIGEDVTGRGSNTVAIGNGSITDAYFGMTTICTNSTACGAGSTASTPGAAGAVILHATASNSFSDLRLKKDIKDSDLGLDFIGKLRPVSYLFKDGNPLLNYGFIAQEVEQALGGRVTSMVTRENDSIGTYELNYSEIISPLVKAVQELKNSGDDECKKVHDDHAADRNDIADLKQLIADQQKQIAVQTAILKLQQNEVEQLQQQLRNPLPEGNTQSRPRPTSLTLNLACEPDSSPVNPSKLLIELYYAQRLNTHFNDTKLTNPCYTKA
jgi:Chaperone of endosialidase